MQSRIIYCVPISQDQLVLQQIHNQSLHSYERDINIIGVKPIAIQVRMATLNQDASNGTSDPTQEAERSPKLDASNSDVPKAVALSATAQPYQYAPAVGAQPVRTANVSTLYMPQNQVQYVSTQLTVSNSAGIQPPQQQSHQVGTVNVYYPPQQQQQISNTIGVPQRVIDHHQPQQYKPISGISSGTSNTNTNLPNLTQAAHVSNHNQTIAYVPAGTSLHPSSTMTYSTGNVPTIHGTSTYSTTGNTLLPSNSVSISNTGNTSNISNTVSYLPNGGVVTNSTNMVTYSPASVSAPVQCVPTTQHQQNISHTEMVSGAPHALASLPVQYPGSSVASHSHHGSITNSSAGGSTDTSSTTKSMRRGATSQRSAAIATAAAAERARIAKENRAKRAQDAAERAKALIQAESPTGDIDNQNINLNEVVLRSKYNGVRWYKRTNKWVVQIRRNGKRKHVGYFSDEEEAADAYKRACESLTSSN